MIVHRAARMAGWAAVTALAAAVAVIVACEYLDCDRARQDAIAVRLPVPPWAQPVPDDPGRYDWPFPAGDWAAER